MLSSRKVWRVRDFVDDVLIALRRDLQPTEVARALDGAIAGRSLERWFPRWHDDDLSARRSLVEIYQATTAISIYDMGLLSPHFLLERVRSAFEAGTVVAICVPCRLHGTLLGEKLTLPLEAPVLASLPKQVLTLDWSMPNAWCGDSVALRGTTRNYADGEKIKIEIKL